MHYGPADAIGAQEFVHAAGITYRQLDYWTRTGVLSVANRFPGNGYARSYSVRLVPIARLMGDLLRAGLATRADEAHRLATGLNADGHASVALPTNTLHLTLERSHR